jgi:glycosyltransferase involved in cell wall biosynthesis
VSLVIDDAPATNPQSGLAAPLVTIGLPVYNGVRYLAQALESLLGQTLADLEVVISDNASTDGTSEMCLAYAARDSRIRYFRQELNIGAPRNWNFVAQQARGKYFKWASANDFCEDQMLEKCVAVLDADPGAVLCHGRTCIVDEETSEHRPFAHDYSAMQPRPSERFRTVCRSLVLNNAQSGVIRLQALWRTRLDRPYPHGDLVLMAELALHGRFVLLPDILLYRRMGRETWSMQLKPAALQSLFHPGTQATPRLDRWRLHADYLSTVLRAPIATTEKLRILPLVARHAAGDLLRGLKLKKSRRAALDALYRQRSPDLHDG